MSVEVERDTVRATLVFYPGEPGDGRTATVEFQADGTVDVTLTEFPNVVRMISHPMELRDLALALMEMYT